MSGGFKPAHGTRTTARLAAIQALYQMELAGAGVEAVVAEFIDHRFERELGEDEPHSAHGTADEAYFSAIVRGVVTDQAGIDRAIARRLAQGWKLERLDATVRAALRAGAWELAHRPDTPSEVVIDEYVELAKGFTDDTGFVNGLLDRVARDVRG